MKKSLLTIVVIVSVSTASYAVGFRLGAHSIPEPPRITPVEIVVSAGEGSPADLDLAPLWEVLKALKEHYVDQSKLDLARMLRGAVAGFVSSIGDPYTVYVEPEEQKKFVEDLVGSFSGIGAEIGFRKGILAIIAPLEGTPAEKAGLKAGDRILKIDDTITNELSLDEAVRLIRGPEGTVVTLTIFSEGDDEAREVKITRQAIVVPSLKWEKRGDVMVVRLLSFNADAADAFRRVVREIQRIGSKKIVLDVRNNPGGFLDVAVDIASWFVPRGETVVIEVDAGGNRAPFLSKGYRGLEGSSIVVLMNQGSASASEILAGALRDDLGVKLIGEKTFGKGSVQELVDLPDGAVLKATTAKWLTPKGVSINEEGLAPDVEAKESEEAPKEGEEPRDLPLEKALELLQ